MSCGCLFKFARFRRAFDFDNLFNSNALLKKSLFLDVVFETLVAAVVAVAVVVMGGGAQEGQFNLKCLSLVCRLLRFKRPGQLELSDFCHFNLFLFFSCNVYFNARPPAVCVQRRQKQLEGRCRYH